MTEEHSGDSDVSASSDSPLPVDEGERSMVDAAVVDPAAEPADLEQLRRLVLDAFKAAAQQGKPDWETMHGTVLKNRLLDLTGRSFSEADYGVTKFSELVDLLSDMIRADHTSRPFVVELLDPHRSQVGRSATAPGASWIRPDLWRAVVDYSSPGTRYWDPTSSTVTDEAGSDNAALPSLDKEILGEWRREFEEMHRDNLNDVERSQVAAWCDNALGASALPPRLVGDWNALVRKRVGQRLLDFFEANGVRPPPDFLGHAPRRQSPSSLRSFVLRCVELMSDQELQEISIPARVAVRAQR